MTQTTEFQDSSFQENDCILITDAGLDALNNAETVPDEPEETDPFTPDTADKVDWVLSKIADRRTAAARIRENAELMARAEERKAEMLEWRYGAAMQTWLRAELEGGRKKSVRLYNGVLGYRQKPAGVSVTNEAAALAWAREHLPEAVAVRLDKKVLAEALLTSGEAVDFAMPSHVEEVFYIK